MRARRWTFAAATWLSAAVLALMLAAGVAHRAGSSFGRFGVGGRFRMELGGRQVYIEYRAPRPLSVGPNTTPTLRTTDTVEQSQERKRDAMRYELWYRGLGRQTYLDWPVLTLILTPDVRQEDGRWVSDGFLYAAHIPDWVVVLPAGALPLWWAVGVARRRRVAARRAATGRCVGCGYDVRTHSGRCPECGMPVAEMPSQDNGA